MERFSDFADEPRILDGDKIRIDKVLNRELVLLAYKITDSKYKQETEQGRCMTLQIELGGERRVIFTASQVLMDQVERHKDRLPFLAVIQKVDRFYKLT